MRSIGRSLTAALLVAFLATGALPVGAADRSEHRRMPAPGAVPRDALGRAFANGQVNAADHAYYRALSLWHLDEVRARFGQVVSPGPRDATMILRDLAAVRSQLSPAHQQVADRLLARPTDGAADPFNDGYSTTEETPLCSAHLCIHWVKTTKDKVSPTDDDLSGVPDYVESASAIFEEVWAAEVDTMGYRPPKSDATSRDPGPDGTLDVYLSNTGAQGYYGYCTTDDPNAFDPSYDWWDVSAFCVVDNDFAVTQFPGVHGLDALRVTAAHEFFHAVQFAYDAAEDAWLMEGTASWIEDEVYDAINDNRGYISYGPLRRPRVPVDAGTGLSPYGTWVFWRFLSERFDPALVQRVWEFADGSSAGPDQHSLRATASAIAQRATTFRAAFAEFGAWNVLPRARYSEGAAWGGSPAVRAHGVTGTNRGVARQTLALDHLTNPHVVFTPKDGVRSRARLWISVDGPSAAASPAATIVVHFRSGATRYRVVTLDAEGRGKRRIAFGRGVVAWAELVLTNASMRTRCWRGSYFSCQGKPTDDDRVYAYAARLAQ